LGERRVKQASSLQLSLIQRDGPEHTSFFVKLKLTVSCTRVTSNSVFVTTLGNEMPRGKRRAKLNERDLSKGESRKLNALRKSLGDEIADRAFVEWLADHRQGGDLGLDRNAAKVAEAIEALVLAGRARIPRGGYLVRRGRGRVIVEQPEI
jgi:hypothetical protein